MTPTTFILSDESLNSYGFRILTEGIDISQFTKNPVMLFNHQTGGETYTGPIGRWENIRFEEGKLLADAYFDTEDETAQNIAGKVERGFIKGASLGINIIEADTNPDLLIDGQTYPTVTKCRVFEASIVDLPSNANSLTLMDESGKKLELSTEEDLTTLSQFKPLKKTSKKSSMKIPLELTQLLKLQTSATEKEVTEKVKELLTKNQTLRKNVKELNAERVEFLVNDAIKSKKITASQKTTYLNLAKADFNSTKKALESIAPTLKPTQIINQKQLKAETKDKSQWSFDDWSKLDPQGLTKLKREEPETYLELLNTKKAEVTAKYTIK